MALRGTTSLLVVVVAASSAAWNIYASAQATVVPFQWVSMLLALLPHMVAVAAAGLVLRPSAWWWRRAALAYVAAFAATIAGGLAHIGPLATQFAMGPLVWHVATSSLALVAAVLAVLALRDGHADATGDSRVPGPFRWASVAGGLLLIASSMFATSASPAGFWIFTLSRASTGVLVGSLVFMAVIAGITAVVATSSQRSLVAGATAGLLASHPLALGIFADRTWQDANASLAAGWWTTLVAQVLLVGALAGFLRPAAAVGQQHPAVR